MSTANVVPTEDYSQGSKELKNQVSKVAIFCSMM